MLFPNGSYFEGEVVKGEASGKGKFVDTNFEYNGIFLQNNFNGQG
jgi:hypothetical protein